MNKITGELKKKVSKKDQQHPSFLESLLTKLGLNESFELEITEIKLFFLGALGNLR